MNKEKILKRILLVSILLLVIIATYIISILYYKNYGQYNEGAKRVYKVPEWYISIKNLEEDTKGKLRYIGVDHNSILIRDLDNIGIDSPPLNDSWSIVRYKDAYYIKDVVYDYWLHDANVIAEQRNRLYNVGDAVILRGGEVIPWVIIISSVETESKGEFMMNTIKFTTNPSVSEREVLKIFDHVETDKGTIIDDFTFVDDGTVQVKLPAGEKISMLILASPANNALTNCIRKVSVEE